MILDAQLKKGLLEMCVLAAIRNQDSYGYQIIKDIPIQAELSESTLYPILKRLEVSHALTVYNVEHNGRLRKYYRITPEGEQKLREFTCDWQQVQLLYSFIEDSLNGKEMRNQ